MSKKNGASSPREGTASAVREAVRSGDPERATSPEGPKRRVFTAEYKLDIVRKADEHLDVDWPKAHWVYPRNSRSPEIRNPLPSS